MKHPKISVIVPVYNIEKYLNKCIDSILSQSFQNFELLLIDDGSKDSSGKICDEYANRDSRIRIYHVENGGVSKARNLGLEQAQGEWVCFVDSDDWIEDNYLSSFGCIESLPENAIVIQGLEHISNQTGVSLWKIEYGNIEFTENDLKRGIAQHCLLHSGFPYAKLFSRVLIKERNIKFDTGISFHEDHLFVFDYFLHVRMVRLSASIAYKYIYYGGNSSLSSKPHKYLESEYAYQSISEKLSKLIEVFELDNCIYLKKIFHFVYQIRMEGLFFCYSLENRNVRLAYLREIRGDIATMNSKYNPQSFVGKILKCLFNVLPTCLLDVVIVLYIKMKGK